MVEPIFQYKNILLAKYTNEKMDYTDYSIYDITHEKPIILYKYETLAEATKEFYRRVCWLN